MIFYVVMACEMRHWLYRDTQACCALLEYEKERCSGTSVLVC